MQPFKCWKCCISLEMAPVMERSRQFFCSVQVKGHPLTVFHSRISTSKQLRWEKRTLPPYSLFHCSRGAKTTVLWILVLQKPSACWMTWHLLPSLITAGDDSDYCYGSCRSDSVKVLRAAHTPGSSATHPYFCHNMHITQARCRVREDLCTCDDGPVKYGRPARVALCDPGGRTGILKITTPVLLFPGAGLCCSSGYKMCGAPLSTVCWSPRGADWAHQGHISHLWQRRSCGDPLVMMHFSNNLESSALQN